MARKAELARESRKRKKVYVQTLQEKARRYASKVEALERRETRALASLGLSSVSRDEQHRRMEQNETLRAMALKIDSRPEGKADAEVRAMSTMLTNLWVQGCVKSGYQETPSKVHGKFPKAAGTSKWALR
mmetsp:Transcript_19216/g.30573  ORF Transcript_19216/g.30573 Transcript_19216/m.30573 type:complete len:130 (+) Transcript_19216:419-808(+)